MHLDRTLGRRLARRLVRSFGRGLLAVASVLLVVMMPLSVGAAVTGAASASAPAPSLRAHARAAFDEPEGGACTEADETPELIECAGEVAWSPDEPALISLMRALDVRMSAVDCDELLREVWSGEACEAGSSDCGKIHTGAPPAPAPKLVSSASSARMSLAELGLEGASSRRLSYFAHDRAPSSRDLPPPTPPPKLSLH